MKIFNSVDEIKRFPKPVLTIGNYDGVHIGHQKIIKKVVEVAGSIGGTPMLMTFNPHPLSILRPERHLGLLMPLYVKKRLLKEYGIEVLIVMEFTDALRQTPPENFVNDILIEKLDIKALIVGYDFKFGRGGSGNTEMLKNICSSRGIFFDAIDAITLDGDKVGSNRIRRLILEGNVHRASQLLGRTYFIEGRVTGGEKKGRALGFPTVNLDTSFEIIPKQGVYISEIGIESKMFSSVTNIGYKPTFDGNKLTIETFILDFNNDVYGRDITLYFHEHIRDEKRFDSPEELREQIRIDVDKAREFFNKNKKVMEVPKV
ncbi:MAG: bifunctional riboflavin kinase/FAD synthetase [Syntrophorhabdaceae bacterium]|nr:bifunctional riboflavin kinase/FAD synthetase [Syntrophorhabdales bacterium]MBP9560987.1 bifunctional riboflavin kinase/FAD synthetase [Syntrophorhabdaceae bacterium]